MGIALFAGMANPMNGQPEMLPETRKELAALAASFARELPAMVQSVVLAIDQLRASPADVALRGIARRRAHQIAGVAGSFGFDAVGDACAGIERAILQMGSSADDWKEVDAALCVLDPILWRARRLKALV
jgi:HPt (histidine-containing phosphotransfer) domain-containing protein